MHRRLAEAVIDARDNRRPVALLTWLASGEQRAVTAAEIPELDELGEAVRQGFLYDRSTTCETSAGEVFIHVINPPLRMIIIGAVHATQFLLPLARMAGHDAIIIDPRTAFASKERFPDAQMIAEWPDDAIPELGLDARTSLIALTHDAKIDDNALKLALASKAYYVGALGSKRSHAKRLERLQADGVSEADLGRIHAPIGLDIGAQGPAEIALSIMAEVTAVLRGKKVLSASSQI